MAGQTNNRAYYWKDGVPFALSNEYYATRSIAVDHGSVYVLNRGSY